MGITIEDLPNGAQIVADIAEAKRLQEEADRNSKVVRLTEANFQEKVYDQDLPVFLEFYAPWCGHCKNLAPTYEKVAVLLEGKIVVAKIDATAERGLSKRFGIKGFPTMKLMRGDAKADEDAIDFSGQRSLGHIINWILTKLNMKPEDISKDVAYIINRAGKNEQKNGE